MVDRRSEILNGELSFPKQLIDILNPTDAQRELISDFWSNLWANFLREKSLDTITWYEAFNDSDMFNRLIFHLSKAGWITSTVDNNYAYIELNESKLCKWVSKEELINVIKAHCTIWKVRARNFSEGGGSLAFEVRTKSPKELIESVTMIEHVTGVSLLEHDGEITV